MRRLVTSYLDDYLARDDAVAFAHRRGLRTVRWSYRQIANSAFAFAKLLTERGVQKSDRVLLSGTNSPEWVVTFFGCLLRGAIVVPLDVQSDAGFVERVQQQVNAKLAIFDTSACQELSFTLPVIPLEEVGELFPTSYSSSARSQSVNDVAEIVFTSGTTAEPKGVVLTHQNLLANMQPLETEIRRYLKWERLVHPIRFLNLLPLSHVFGQFMGIFVPQLLGGEVFFIDSLKPSQIIETVKRERISVIVCVPRMLDTLRERVEREYERASGLRVTAGREHEQAFQDALDKAENWSVPRRWWEFRRLHQMLGWKFWAFISGGATLDGATEKFWQRLGFAVIQGYGLTETASLVSVNHPFRKKPGSIGRVMPGQEMTLSNDGEILVRGANVSSGYWNIGHAGDSSAIRAAKGTLHNSSNPRQDLDEAKWLHTGDVGELDAKGNLYFKGRKKEIIVTAAGMNVYPEDIEVVLNHQPEIRSAAVVGIDGPQGPEPVAALIIRAGTPELSKPGLPQPVNVATGSESINAEMAQVIERANQSLAEHQRLRRWFIWPEEDFPRTTTQKIKRRLVAQRIKAASLQPATSVSPNPLADLIARVSGEPAATLDPGAKLGTDVKLDSLGRLELLSALEDRYQIEIIESVFTEATTIGDIQTLIQKAGLEQMPLASGNSLLTRNQKSRFSEYPYPHWPHRWPINWLRIAGLYLIIFPFVRVMGRARVQGAENLKNCKPPLLFVSNHLSMVDHALILWALPGRFRRRMSIAMDGELLRGWLNPSENTNWFTRLRYLGQYLLIAFFFNVFAMPQHGGFRRSFAFAGEMMDLGYSVLVFPEGRRSSDGNLHTFRAGIGLLAKQLYAPIVPVRLDGVYQLAQQGKHFAPPGAITINIGAPIHCSVQNSAEQISQELEGRVKEAPDLLRSM
jgi:long-chain acyl-CoA synthetase